MKKLKVIAELLWATASTLGVAATVRKDVRNHSGHDEHDPCDCDRRCLACLFRR